MTRDTTVRIPTARAAVDRCTSPPRCSDGPTTRYITYVRHVGEKGIENGLTMIRETWTNGQVERMNRTIKEALLDDSSSAVRERQAHLKALRAERAIAFEAELVRLVGAHLTDRSNRPDRTGPAKSPSAGPQPACQLDAP